MTTNDVPNWIWVGGGLAVVAVATWTGSKWGAWLVVLIVLSMLSVAYSQGKINYGN